MLFRYTVVFVLVAVAAGACSGSQDGSVLPSATISNQDIITSITTSTTRVLDLSYLGLPRFQPETPRVTVPGSASSTVLEDLGEVEISGSVLELIGAANAACEAAVESPEVSQCGEAVLLACDVGIAEVASSADSGIMPEDVVKHVCHAAVVAESGELGYVLSERYSDMSVSKNLYFVGNRGGYESFRNQIRDEISELFDSLSGWEISVATREVLLGLSRNVSNFARPFSERTVLIY